MDRIRKSVVERHMTLLIVVHRASGFALASFYGFLIVRQANYMENRVLHRTKKLRKAVLNGKWIL